MVHRTLCRPVSTSPQVRCGAKNPPKTGRTAPCTALPPKFRPTTDLLPQTHDKDTIPTIPTDQQRCPSSDPQQRPLLLPPKCRPPTTVKISFLRPTTEHPKNRNLPYPPFPQTNIYLLTQTYGKDHYCKPQTTHMQTLSHLPLISSSPSKLTQPAQSAMHHHTKPSPVGDAIYRFHS